MLCSRIAALRRQKGLSQAQLAKQLGVSPSAVGMYEQGRREPSADTLVALSEVFGVSVDFLLTGRAFPQERQELERMILDRIAAAQQRKHCPFTRDELAVLFAAMLLEA